MGVRGDFGKLKSLAVKIGRVASSDVMPRLAKVMGAEALTQVQLGFRAGRDPYGEPWAPLKLRQGGKPLLDTGRLRNSFSVQTESSGFRIGTNFIGAAVHQYGATITAKRAKFLKFKASRKGPWVQKKSVTIPARRMVPEGSLGATWETALNGAATRFLSRIMR